ncbi:sigma factor-like helix-turn-helix DNA-binding protein [Hankyongella ginsenosidimutans]|uniref:sigma factor-like helix-turn-helix DNA-binding protein n=1 Tax=Hankyongella ginsenosidimutans TaxID=1763828 RepID=UPI00319DC1B9
MERLLAILPSAQSAVIRLTKIDGLSIEEAASLTGQSTSLVKVNIHRGLKRMSALIETMDRKLQAELP